MFHVFKDVLMDIEESPLSEEENVLQHDMSSMQEKKLSDQTSSSSLLGTAHSCFIYSYVLIITLLLTWSLRRLSASAQFWLAVLPPPRSRQLVQWREWSFSSLGVIHSRPRIDKRQGMRSIPQGHMRINSKSAGLRGASSLQDTKRQGAGDSPRPRDWVGWALGRDGNNSFLKPDTWDIQVLSWSFMSLCILHMSIQIRNNSYHKCLFFLYWTSLNCFLHACVG